jgi:AraC-like DNA-binding protein
MGHRALPTRSAAVLRLLERPSDENVEPRDEYVARAIAPMAAQPARGWTVAALARIAGLSRAPLSRRFRRVTGTSPLRWLTAHRLWLAQSRLVASDLTLAAIAREIGYSTEFAFSKAFKRLFGIAPTLFRRIANVEHGSSTPRFRAAA